MTENYITLSLETHLFFARIMKEHSLFLEAGFPCKEESWIRRAEQLRQEFENLLSEVVKISDGRVNSPILGSNELVTDFTISAENKTQSLSGIPINSEITRMQKNLHALSDNQIDNPCSCQTNIENNLKNAQQSMERQERFDKQHDRYSNQQNCSQNSRRSNQQNYAQNSRRGNQQNYAQNSGHSNRQNYTQNSRRGNQQNYAQNSRRGNQQNYAQNSRRSNQQNYAQNSRRNNRQNESQEIFTKVHRINEHSLQLLNNLIDFKENILKKVKKGELFTSNYPLLIEHILREARQYHSAVKHLMHSRQVSYATLFGTEDFWNRIMMEHALFIRGLLDPCEENLISTANDFAEDYKKLLQTTKNLSCTTCQDSSSDNTHNSGQNHNVKQNGSSESNDLQEKETCQNLTEASLQKTMEYCKFKAAGTKGILECEISSVILPLLADHVLREANHYIRILQAMDLSE